MKCVGIITIQSIVNYGNRLQNYAVEQILEQRGYTVESIRIAEPMLWFKIYTKAFLSKFFLSKSSRNAGTKTRKFLKFNNSMIHLKVISRKKAKTYFEKFDHVFIGGDQLWASGNKDHGIDGYRFGSLVAREKRIPFGVSFGTDTISESYASAIQPWLNEFNRIAIREMSGAEIIYRLTGKKAHVLLDPVFGLTAEKWSIFAGKENCNGEKYAAEFLLGGNSREAEDVILKVAPDITIKQIHNPSDKISTAGPEEFVRIIRDAQIVFTDSFHCTAFAILFQKPFVVFSRNNWDKRQMTRITNLLKMFHMEDRVYNGKDMDWYDIDFCNAENVLTAEKEKMKEYLDIVLGEKND